MSASSNNAKVRISLRDGLFEFEGTEAFVRECITEFKSSFEEVARETENPTTDNHRPQNSKPTSKPQVPKTQRPKTAKKKSNKVVAERFDIHGTDKIKSLEDFLEEKKPNAANGEKIVALGYYITELMGQPFFTEGQIEYAYKMLEFKRPGHLHQIMINNKNQNDWFEQNEDDTGWVLTRSGDIFVSDKMPQDVE